MTARLLGIVQLLLLAAAGLIVAQAWTSLRHPDGPPAMVAASDTRTNRPPAAARRFHRNDLRAITTRNLFRTEPGRKQADPAAVDVDRLERTELNLRLWGTIAGESDETYAVIEAPRFKTQHLYREGDRIEDATVKRILRQKVVLTRAGRDEVLLMEKPVSGAPRRGSQPPARQAATRRTARRAQTAPPAPPAPAEVEARPAPGRTVNLTREMLAPVAELLEAEGDDLFAFVDADEDGDGGARVAAGNRAPVLRQLGLRNGDVIIRVDDAPVVDAADVVSLFSEMSQGEEAVVTVRRGRREQTLRYRLP